MEILITWAVLTLGMFLASKLLSRMEIEGGVGSHLVVSAVFGLILAVTGWFFHLALGFLSLGLLFFFGFVAQVLVGAIVLKITDAFFERLRVEGFGTALLAALIISVTGTLARAVLHAVA
jgi:uncharacterized membrane protein YvlD (DUF360 family)